MVNDFSCAVYDDGLMFFYYHLTFVEERIYLTLVKWMMFSLFA